MSKYESFDVTVKAFVTNENPDILGSYNGFLGIAPCPDTLQDYSFAHKLLQYYKDKNLTVFDEGDKLSSFRSLEWVLNSTSENTGDRK